MTLKCYAPTRIDLAGGTLDIFPLYIFEGGGLTVNCAITLFSRVEISPGQGITITARDLGETVSAPTVEELIPKGVMELLVRAVRFSRPDGGLSIVTENNVPKGSGLGASSSLLVTLLWALLGEKRAGTDPHTFIDWCANIEAQSLGIPTGKQDYYAAFYGGLNAIHFDERGITREAITPSENFMSTLSQSMILSYTGISHFSGATNWDMMKSYIDNAGSTRENMKRIKETSYAMRESLIREDLTALALALSEEWNNRKRLAEGVTNDTIEKMVAAAKTEGALASKICGAGAGGCMITIAPPEKRADVIEALTSHGAVILDCRISQQGVTVKGEH
ncbi:MAG: hypothetical protein AB2L14_09015 [Candidatus Xenobiia bacterium LiM19]